VTTPVDLIPAKQTLDDDDKNSDSNHHTATTSLPSSSHPQQAPTSSSTVSDSGTNNPHPNSTSTIATAANTNGDSTDPESDEKAPYPMSFAHIVELITTGKPIPGIKQIPDTLHGEEASTVSAKAPRRKPWETTLAETQAQT